MKHLHRNHQQRPAATAPSRMDLDSSHSRRTLTTIHTSISISLVAGLL